MNRVNRPLAHCLVGQMSKPEEEPTFGEILGVNSKISSLRQTAQEMGRSIYFLREEIAKKRIAHRRLGNRIFFAEEDITEYLARCRVPANAEDSKK
jgi:hypothetical protein